MFVAASPLPDDVPPELLPPTGGTVAQDWEELGGVLGEGLGQAEDVRHGSTGGVQAPDLLWLSHRQAADIAGQTLPLLPSFLLLSTLGS